jgi:hypothetical protein
MSSPMLGSLFSSGLVWFCLENSGWVAHHGNFGRMFLLFSGTCFLAHQILFGACFSLSSGTCFFWCSRVLHVLLFNQRTCQCSLNCLNCFMFCYCPIDSKSEVPRHKTWYYLLA